MAIKDDKLYLGFYHLNDVVDEMGNKETNYIGVLAQLNLNGEKLCTFWNQSFSYMMPDFIAVTETSILTAGQGVVEIP